MSSKDIFSKSDIKVGMVKEEEVVLKTRSKRASSLKKVKPVKVKKENHRDIIPDFGVVQNIDKEFLEEVVLVNPEQSSTSGRKRVKYSVSQDVNRRFLITLQILERLAPFAKELGFTKSEFERNIIKPVRKFVISGKAKSGSKSQKQNKNDNTVKKLSSFELPRKAKVEFDKLYRKLEDEEDDNDYDLSLIPYENGFVSLLKSAETIRMYINSHELVNIDTKHIVLDEFLEELFKEKIEGLYAKNNGKFITQPQVQTLASWIVNTLK